MKTKIFCDIADLKTIRTFNKKSVVDGFTTNPSLMRKAGAKNYKDYSLNILNSCTRSITESKNAPKFVSLLNFLANDPSNKSDIAPINKNITIEIESRLPA